MFILIIYNVLPKHNCLDAFSRRSEKKKHHHTWHRSEAFSPRGAGKVERRKVPKRRGNVRHLLQIDSRGSVWQHKLLRVIHPRGGRYWDAEVSAHLHRHGDGVGDFAAYGVLAVVACYSGKCILSTYVPTSYVYPISYKYVNIRYMYIFLKLVAIKL